MNSSVQSIEEETLPLMETSTPTDESLFTYTKTLQEEFDEEVNFRKKVST